MIGVMLRSSNGSSILSLSNLLCDVPNSFPCPDRRNLFCPPTIYSENIVQHLFRLHIMYYIQCAQITLLKAFRDDFGKKAVTLLKN